MTKKVVRKLTALSRRRTDRRWEAEALQVALDYAEAGNPRTDEHVILAGLLASAVPVREAPRAQAKDRAMRAFRAAGAPTGGVTGSRDDLGAPEVYTAQVEVAGATVRLANVEPINETCAAKVAESADTLARLELQWEGER